MFTSENLKLFVKYLSLIIWFLNSFVPVDSKKALIFNNDREIFDEIPAKGPACFSACPAESQNEANFNRTKSKTKSSLFLKNAIVLSEVQNGLSIECKHSYKPSILFREYGNVFEIGYEIYFELNKLQGQILKLNADQFLISLEEVKKNYKPKSTIRGMLHNGFGFKRKRSKSYDGKSDSDSENGKNVKPQTGSSDTIKDTYQEAVSESVPADIAAESDHATEGEEFEKIEKWEKSLKFIWIPIIDFYFKLEQFSTTKAEYFADISTPTEINANYECQEYYVNKELYEDMDLKSIYEEKNQAKLFEGLPAFSKLSTSTVNRCGNEYGCLKQHQLIPHYYYHPRALKNTTCFAVNTLPVWENISDGFLKKVDRYLYAISQIWGPKVTITTGIKNVLTYKTFRRTPTFREREIYLDLENEKIPAPEMIYKILEVEKKDVKYNLVIVIHNDPTLTKIQHMCPPALGDAKVLYEKVDSSWKFLINEDFKTGRTYPCPMRPSVLDNLGVERRRSNDEYLQTLFLKEGEQEMIENKVKELFKEAPKK